MSEENLTSLKIAWGAVSEDSRKALLKYPAVQEAVEGSGNPFVYTIIKELARKLDAYRVERKNLVDIVAKQKEQLKELLSVKAPNDLAKAIHIFEQLGYKTNIEFLKGAKVDRVE